MQGKRTAIVCKSLFGKAHTVMAEGGAAAAMGNVNPNDNWQVHFRDTMRGGKFLNNWRMAELHAKEAPDRVWELETYGALFDRTKDGKISQRNFGGHEYPRLAHVGDRTGLEMIRTLQQKIVSLQQDDQREHRDAEAMIKVFAETTITALLKDGERISGAVGYTREDGTLVVFEAPAVILATGGIGKSFKVTSNSWEYTGDGHALAMKAGATLLNMEFVQFHPTGMVWPPERQGHPRHRVGARRRRRAEELRGQALHVRLRPRRLPQAVRGDRGGGRPLVHRPRQQPAAAGAAAARRGRPGHQLRGQGRPRLPGRRRLPRHLLPAARRRDPQEAAVDVPPVQGAGRRRHHRRSRWRSARPATTSWAASRSTRTRLLPSCPACSPPARSPAACTARTGSAATRCPTCWSSAAAPGSARRSTSTRSARSRPAVTDEDVEAARRRGGGALRRQGRREPVRHPRRAAADDERPRRHHPHRGRGARQALEKLEDLKARAKKITRPGRQDLQPGLAPRARPAQHAASSRSASPGPR